MKSNRKMWNVFVTYLTSELGVLYVRINALLNNHDFINDLVIIAGKAGDIKFIYIFGIQITE